MSTSQTLFTPWAGLIGGGLIGLSAALLMLLDGRIAGISGMAGRFLGPAAPGARGRAVAFLVGMVAAPVLLVSAGRSVVQTVPGDLAVLIAAGLLVGFGSALGRGCTSGHGVCGLARLSPRSLVATLVFMSTAVATVFAIRHLGVG